MGRLLLHGLALAGSGAAGVAAAMAAGLHPVAGPLLGGTLYLLLREAGRRGTDRLGRLLLLARSGLRGEGRARFSSALDLMDRGHPDVARSIVDGMRSGEPGGAVVYQAWARACLRLASHRSFGSGGAEAWAGVTAGRRRPLPRLERALLAPPLAVEEGPLAAEAAVADDRSLAAILGTRALLLGTLLPAVGNPFRPFHPRAEQDLERMLGRRFLLLPRRRLRALARGIQPARLLPPREEAALLLLAFGREEAASALLAGGDAAGTLTRRGRALRSASLVLLFLRGGGGVAVSPDLFLRRTREIFFLHTRAFAMTRGSPHVEAIPDGPRRLLGLLREKRELIEALGLQWARRPAMGRLLGPLVRRLGEGPGPARAPRGARAFLRWWREEGRLADDACAFNLRGLDLLREGRAAEAAGEFERSLELDPRLEAAAFNLAVASLEGGLRAEDPARRLEALAEAPGGEGRAGLLLGEFLRRAERWAEAEEVYRRLLDGDPMDADANLALGRLLLDDGRGEEAEDPLRRALAARAGDPEALVPLALVRLEGGHPAEAIPLLRSAVEASDGDRREEARWLLHVAYRESGDPAHALATLDAVPDRFLRWREDCLEEAALFLEERSRFDRASRLQERLRELRARRGEL